LKEWASVCDALDRGMQIVLLRKGGIDEVRGDFAVEHPEFFLYPTWEHQRAEHLQPRFREALEGSFREPPGHRVPILDFARVEKVLRVGDLSKLRALTDHYVWTSEHVVQRHAYKPSKPMFVMLLRVFRLPEVRAVAETPRYAGCKSWVDLDEPLGREGARPVLDDARFAKEAAALSRALA
jgi:hypothetical protein